MDKVVRTHDSFYKFESLEAPPKDSFIQVGNLIEEYKLSKAERLSIVDFGCATGAFISYLSRRFPSDEVKGLEFLEELISKGRSTFPLLEFEQASILERSSLPDNSVDVVTVLGVISIFDDVEPVIKNLSCWLKPGGKVIFHGMFNPFDIDVFIKYKISSNYQEEALEAGWNIISQSTFRNMLQSNGCKSLKFHKFNITVDILPSTTDPSRSWTEKLQDGSRQIVNSLCLKQPQYIVEADF